MLPSRYFSDLTQPEIAAQLKRNPLVILPAGSVEQHGPHLPTGTDIFAANVIGHRVAERMDGLVLPGTPASRRCTCRSRGRSRSPPTPTCG
jgi:creatinine amidohydrolase